MREHEKAETYSQAIDLLVTTAVEQAKPKSPGAYAATVRADLRERHRAAARVLFTEHGELNAEHLALLLSAADKPADPPPSPAAALPTVRATDPLPPAARREIARKRIAAIKAELPSITKPPMPAKESA